MKVRLTQNTALKQKQLMRRRLILLAAASSITGLVIALVFLFNIGNVRNAFSAATTYYSRANGDWNSASTWSTTALGGSAAASYPKAGDIVIISGNTVSVKADADAKSITINQSKTQPTTFNVQDGKKLNVTGNIEVNTDVHSQPVSLQIFGDKTNVIVGGDLVINKIIGGSKGTIDLSVKNTSTLNIAGNLITSYRDGDANINITVSDYASINVGNNISLTDQKAKGSVNFTVQDNAIVSVDGDLTFLSDTRGLVYYTMKTNAQTIVGGSIIKQDDSKLYGSFSAIDNSKLTLTGEQTQTIAGGNSNGDMFSVKNLTVNTADGAIVSTTGNIQVTGQLTFIKGIVKTTDNSLISLTSTATSTGSSETSYIDGPMAKEGNTAFVFPIGKNGKYAPLSIAAPSVSSTFKAEYFNTAYNSTANNAYQAPLQNVSQVEYWKLLRTNGTGTTSAKLFWNDAIYSGIKTTSDLKVAYLDATNNTWKPVGSTVASTGTNQGNIATSTLSDFGVFTLGSSGGSPLPVNLISWDVKPKTDYVALSWATASEINNDYFTVERSADGKEFEKITTVKGAGNAQEKLKYGYEDRDPLPGISYYRLKQTDFNGQFEYFPVKSVNIPVAQIDNVGPNPFSNSITINYNMLKASSVTIQLVNLTGTVVYESAEQANQGNNTFVINNQQNLTKGIYILRLNAGGQPVSYKLVKS